MKSDLAIPLIISISLHILLFIFGSYRSKGPIFITIPVELSFYNLSSGGGGSSSIVSDVGSGSQVQEKILNKDDIQVPSNKSKDKKKNIQKKEKNKLKNKNKLEKQLSSKIINNEPQKIDSECQSGGGSGFGIKHEGKDGGYFPGPYGMGLNYDTKLFPYPYYTNAIIKKIDSNWQWMSGVGDLKAVIYFRILRNGNIDKIEVKVSSGDKVYDERAIRAIERSVPFPPFPDGYKEDSLGVYFEFSTKI